MSGVLESIWTLEDAAKAELQRKSATIRACRGLSADDALEQALKWQEKETGQADGFNLTESHESLYYRVWYRRCDTATHHEEVVIKTDTPLYHWPSINAFLTNIIRNTHDPQCNVVATFVASALE